MPKDRVQVDILANTKNAMSGLKGMLGSLAKIGGVIAGMRGLQQVLNKSVEAYNRQIESESKLASVLKSTGNQTGFTGKQLKDYASELQNLTGVGDEVIINAQAQLATFTKIGEDVFPRATSVALDLSKAFDQDLKSSTIQIGKALQDPIQGVTALRRVGVQLTDEQENMIKKFVKLGDVTKAQEIILGELESQVGGVAKAFGETTTGQVEIFKSNIGDLSEGLGEAIMVGMAPLVQQANEFFKNNKTKIINILKNLPQLFLDTMTLVKDILNKTFTFDNLKDLFANISIGFVKYMRLGIERIPKMFIEIFKFLTAPVKNFGEWLGSVFKNVFGNVGNFFIDVLNKIPFVELKRATVSPIQDFGDAWQETLDEMGTSFDKLVDQGKDFVVDVGKVVLETGKDIAAQYKNEVDAYKEKVVAIMNEKEKETKVIEELTQRQTEIEEESLQATIDLWKEKTDKISEAYKNVESIVSEVWGNIGNIVSQTLKNEELNLENRYNKEKKAIEESQKTEEEKQVAMLDLEKKFDRERAAIKRKAAIADKAAAIIESIINTATAVVKALTLGPIAGPIMAGVIGGLGIAQTAIIASQPIPAFATGGSFVTSSPQMFMAGDNASGRERITVEPIDKSQTKKVILKIGDREFLGYLQDIIDDGDLRLARAR